MSDHFPHHACRPHPAYAKLVVDADRLPSKPPGQKTERTPEAKATHIFTGTIITMNESQPKARAMAVTDTHIIAVGSAEEVEAFAQPDTQRVDLGDQVMYPGLIESHMHVWVSAVNYDWIDCSAFSNRTLDEVKKRLADAAAKAQPGEWILGKLFDPSLLEGNPDLTIADLDPITPHNPVFVLNASMHFAYVNSAALKLAGLEASAPDPEGGTFGRDQNGNLNGILSEMAAIAPVMQKVSSVTPESLAKNIASVTNDAARVGVTAMREAGTGALLGSKEIGLLHHLCQEGALKTRLSLALFDDGAKSWPESPETANLAGDDYVWIGARKLVSDGSNQGQSGYQSQPYLHSDDRGKLDMTPEQLQERLSWCHQNGWQTMVHANGDAAVDVVTKAYSKLLKNDSGNDRRHRIEHCSLVANDQLFSEMAQIGVSPSFLINHVYYWGKTLRDNILGVERTEWLDRTKSAVDAGLKFTMHSDYNVSPINPLHYVKVAATRTMWDGGEVLNEKQRVSVYQALKAITIDAAWQMHADDRLGSLQVGKFADFVILDKDPQAIDPNDIDHILIKQTWMGGQLTHQAS